MNICLETKEKSGRSNITLSSKACINKRGHLKMTALKKFKKICHKYFIMRDTTHIDVIFATIFANRLNSKPVWLYLVGPPSSGKTEILQALSGGQEIFPLSRISANTLVSGKQSKDGKDCSLLPQLNGKVIIIKDFTAMLTMRPEILHEILGQLRDAYDGSVFNRYGTEDGNKFYHSKFGCIAAVTSVIDKHRRQLAELGERFLTYRMPPVSEYESHQRCMKLLSITRTREQEAELACAAKEILELSPIPLRLNKWQHQQISDIAYFTAIARCEIERDYKTGEPSLPQPEVATRLAKQLNDIAIGLAMVRQKSAVTQDELDIVKRMALSSLTAKRIRLLECLLQNYPDYVKIQEISSLMKFPIHSIYTYVEDLLLLNLIEKKTIYGEKMKPISVFRIKKDKLLTKIFNIEKK